jgi:adenylate cyclase
VRCGRVSDRELAGHAGGRSQSITLGTGRKLNLITIGLLVAVLLVVGADRTLLPQRGVEGPVDVSAEAVTDKSIAVLAFEDLSADGDQAYFADGLSEELLNVLANVPDLKVAGRASSFAFKG